ncbi:MAG: arylsulfatase [Planctomycetaceae bacterium]
MAARLLLGIDLSGLKKDNHCGNLDLVPGRQGTKEYGLSAVVLWFSFLHAEIPGWRTSRTSAQHALLRYGLTMFQFLTKTQAGCRRLFPRHLQHRITTQAFLLLAVATVQLCYGQPLHADQPRRPNIVLIMADDMGYSDAGCYGSEIQTPNLDALAAGGLRLSQFYNTARCWPTRAALLTGYYAQQVRRDFLPGIGGGNKGERPVWAPLLPDLLKSAGYRSYHSGKWHIDGKPLEGGFDHSYLLNDQSRFFSPKSHFEDDKALPAIQRDSGFYGTVAIADHALKCLKQHGQEHSDEPFFHYVAFTAPHFPLHAMPEDIAKYRDRYSEGWDVIRQQRFEKQKALGLHEYQLSAVERKLGPPYDFPDQLKILGDGEVNHPIPWKKLTPRQQKFQAEKMAIHAAMVDRIDQEIGRILQQLRDMQAMDNTVIFFLSDNGASAEIMVRGDGHDPMATPGSAATHLCLGPGWSTVCNTPFRRHKTWVHEGGIATPLIVHWPNRLRQGNQIRHQTGHVIDLVPTILDVCGVQKPNMWKDVAVPEAPGTSLLPVLENRETQPHAPLWWFHDGHRAVRDGDWKLVSSKNDPWELYNLAKDRAEQKNLAKAQPDRVRQLEAIWDQYADQFRQQLQN